MSNEEIANAVVNELTLAYMQAGSKIGTANALDVAKSLCESLDFKDAVEVKATFRRAKMMQDIPTQRTLAEALANHRAETFSQTSSLPLIENRDPRAAWLPESMTMKIINMNEAIKNYCAAVSDKMSGCLVMSASAVWRFNVDTMQLMRLSCLPMDKLLSVVCNRLGRWRRLSLCVARCRACQYRAARCRR